MKQIENTLRLSAAIAFSVAIGFQPLGQCKEKFLTIKETEPVLSGRVIDAAHQPLPNIQLKLTSLDQSEVKVSADTERDGTFSIHHKPCEKLRLEVYPPRRSELTCALLENIPGEASRQVVVELHPGVVVSGRIIHNGHGLGNLDIAFISADNQSDKRQHGGGLARTGHNGDFEIRLSPGVKKIEISNSHYPELTTHFETTRDITPEGTIGDITLPSARAREGIKSE